MAPGTTDCLLSLLHESTSKVNGKDFNLVFCPERVAQGKALAEIKNLPQLIGAYSEDGYEQARIFFAKIGVFKTSKMLTPTEAEIGKLMTNMYRYVNFAFSNEMYMISRNYDVDIHKVIEECNRDYPRMNMPMPGPNVGGPCLAKDGKLLVETIPYCDLVNNAFLINESMPQFIFNESKKLDKSIRTALIMGMTFKKENDDTRLSLSFKLNKILKKNNIKVIKADGYINRQSIYDPFDFNIADVDAIYFMTPHKHLLDDYRFRLKDQLKSDCVIVDAWKSLEQPRTIFLNKDFK